jgi:PKD repeat protein
MYHASRSPSGFHLITAGLVLLLLLLPGTACADTPEETPVLNVTMPPAVPVNANLSYPANPGIPLTIPPRVFLTRTATANYTSTVYGTAFPGTLNATITAILWDWGDNRTPEYHEFPHSHTYSSPGTYTLSVTAFQSDGQITTVTDTIGIVRSILPEITIGFITTPAGVQPAGPGVLAGAPVLTLLEPVTDGMNVTLNGNLNAGGPGVTISLVTITWDDGNVTETTDFPATHQYSGPGIFTVNITGTQSDGQSITKGITVNLRGNTPGAPGPVASNPPPGQQPLYLIILGTAIVVAVSGGVTQQILHRRRISSTPPDIPETVAAEEERYYHAKEKGDMPAAAGHAHACARMFTSLAEQSPRKRIFYLEMAETWETKAKNAERPGAREHPLPKTGGMPENLPSREELDRICSGTDVAPVVIDAVIRVAVEIAREGREGQAVGTSFVVGDTDTVLHNSRQFVLNPFQGHREEERQITDTGIRGNIKEFAQLDGAFIVSGTGTVEAAGRYITVDMSQVQVPGGLGSRHSSIAGITMVTKSIGVVVSQSGGLITIFRDGKILSTISS